MTPEQITAIAREFTEEIYPHEEMEDIGQMAFLRNSATKHIETALKKLSQRYCLVERRRIQEEYKTCASLRDNNSLLSPNIASVIRHDRGIEGIRVLESLFPEIAKEVEG